VPRRITHSSLRCSRTAPLSTSLMCESSVPCSHQFHFHLLIKLCCDAVSAGFLCSCLH
jgi:hypothetical protein